MFQSKSIEKSLKNPIQNFLRFALEPLTQLDNMYQITMPLKYYLHRISSYLHRVSSQSFKSEK